MNDPMPPDQSWPVYWLVGVLAYLAIMTAVGWYVAAAKARPEGEAIVLSVLFGPLGAILAALLPDGDELVRRRARLEAEAAAGAGPGSEAGSDEVDVSKALGLPPSPPKAPPVLPRRPAEPAPPPKPRRLLGEVKE